MQELKTYGPSIYDLRTEGERVRLRWTQADMRHVDVHTEN